MAKYSIGIDLGGTKILAAIVDITTGKVLYSSKKKTKKDKGADKITKKVIELVKELSDESGIPLADVGSVGLGLAGQVDREKGILIAAPNLDCFNVNFKAALEAEYNIPVFIGNDVEVATVGELMFGAGKGHENYVCVFVGTGVGSGIVINGKIHSGYTGTAGEIGHITVSQDGRACGCGANGCLEAYASRTAIEQKIKGAIKKGHKSIITELIKDDGIIRSKYLKTALDNNDEIVLNCITEAAEYLSSGLASVINFLNPEMIILGGGLVDAIDFFFDLTTKKTLAKCLPTPSEKTNIVKAKLGDFSGVVGAAMLKTYREQL
ncbi:MAG: ROK family protein [bacterium]|nr:ROK family protein [bacterium]